MDYYDHKPFQTKRGGQVKQRVKGLIRQLDEWCTVEMLVPLAMALLLIGVVACWYVGRYREYNRIKPDCDRRGGIVLEDALGRPTCVVYQTPSLPR